MLRFIDDIAFVAMLPLIMICYALRQRGHAATVDASFCAIYALRLYAAADDAAAARFAYAPRRAMPCRHYAGCHYAMMP